MNLTLRALKIIPWVSSMNCQEIHSVSISSQTSNLIHYEQTNRRKIMKLICDKPI
jgi:hypothetical protein